MKLIIWDLEVFKYDFLFGSIILNDGVETIYQTWDKEEVKKFFNDNKDDSIFIGWNSKFYDDIILESYINDQDPFIKSKEIIEGGHTAWCNLKFYTFDAMNTGYGAQYSLKLTELIKGDSIETTEVDFNLDRHLTDEEKLLTERYNYFDLKQTLYNFKMCYDRFLLRLDIINEFNLDLMKCLNMTGAQIAAEALGAKKSPSLKYNLVKPKLYDNLEITNKDVLDFYLNEEFRNEGAFKILHIGNAELKLGAGGLHSAEKKVYYDKLLYLDVSGYYNLVMINYDLLSRAIPQEGKEKYSYMYQQQLELKKIDPDGPKRKAFKTILLAVFGAQGNAGSAMFDEQIGTLVPITGELFLIDLLEKIYIYCTIVQTNTDGIMLHPNSDEDEKIILEILDKWLERTKFNIKPKHIYNLYQRDVNNYLYQDEKGNIEVKGESLKNYDFSDDAYSAGTIFNCKEPPIIAKGIVDCLLFNKSPRETVDENKKNLRLFQYACKKGAYDYLTYDVEYFPSHATSSIEIPPICRVFAYNDQTSIGMIYKHGTNKKSGKVTKAKVSNLPDNIFIYNDEILSDDAYNNIKDKIDYEYYIDRIYEKINNFI